MNNYIFTNDRVRLEIEPESGRIVSCVCEPHVPELIREPRLSENWRLLVRMPAGVTQVSAQDQTLASCRINDSTALLEWKGLQSLDEKLDISVLQFIELDGDTITARLEVSNETDYAIEEIYPLCIGGLANWEEQDDWYLCVPGLVWGGEEFQFYRDFPGSYIGPNLPSFAYTYPGTSVDFWQQNLSMSWVTLYNKHTGQAVYVGNHNPEVDFSAFWGALSPFASFANPLGRWGPQVWPHPTQAGDDTPIGASFGWVFFPFLKGHETYSSPEVVYHFHSGGWWESARYYRRWFRANVAATKVRESGMAQWDAWQATFMDSPDGRVRLQYSDLEKYAADAKAFGVNLIMIAGWHEGGIDTNYPRFAETNPRLGTREDFEAAIAACEAASVTVLIWANANQLNVETDWYKEELHQYAIKNRYGDPYPSVGYGFDTLLNLTGHTAARMVAANMAHPRLREIIVAEWERARTLGSGAFLIDKIISGEPYHMDFNPAAPGRIENNAHRALLDSVAEFAARLEEHGTPLALETGWDRMMPYCDAVYTRYFGYDHIPVQEVVFPEVKQTCCINGDFDFGLVNKSLRFGHIMAFEGINGPHSVADMPHLGPYMREALRLRRELADNIWWSSFIEQTIAEVTHAGKVYCGAHESWRDIPASGSRHALVLHHYEREPQQVDIAFKEKQYSRAVLYRPFTAPEPIALPVRTTISPDNVLIIIPQQGS